MTDTELSGMVIGAAVIKLHILLVFGRPHQQLAAVFAWLDLHGLPCRLRDIGRAGSPVRQAHAVLRAAFARADDLEEEVTPWPTTRPTLARRAA